MGWRLGSNKAWHSPTKKNHQIYVYEIAIDGSHQLSHLPAQLPVPYDPIRHPGRIWRYGTSDGVDPSGQQDEPTDRPPTKDVVELTGKVENALILKTTEAEPPPGLRWRRSSNHQIFV